MKKPIVKLKFANGLVPAVIQDYKTERVLMVAYMNRESLEKTLETEETHFWSRSRKKLWRKGETSGHIQKVKAIYMDCDQDTLLIKVEQQGVACHTGQPSCFFEELGIPMAKKGKAKLPLSAPAHSPFYNLYRTISARKGRPSSKSYTSSLFKGGIDLILKKVAEETGEFMISAKNKDKKAIIHESADVIYHLWVALNQHQIPLKAIEDELERRSAISGLAEKQSRGKLKKPKGAGR